MFKIQSRWPIERSPLCKTTIQPNTQQGAFVWDSILPSDNLRWALCNIMI